MHEIGIVSYSDLNIDTRVIGDRLFIDSEQLAVHISAAAYGMRLALQERGIQDPIMWAGAETMRNMAVLLWDTHDMTVAGDEKMFDQGLDKILDID